MSTVNIGGRMFIAGTKLKLRDNAQNFIPGKCAGLEVTLFKVRSGSPPLVGLYSHTKEIAGWGDLDHDVDEGRGWWISVTELQECIHYDGALQEEYMIKTEFIHQNIDLKGKPCQIITHFSDGKTVFVEFEEHVGGCSGDGNGKAGHCVALPHKMLTKYNSAKSAKKKE